VSGHSKWSTIKHKKAAQDKKRGKLFSTLIREICVAARDGGGDIEFNPKLRRVVEKAKSYNMPAENIKRAIQRGTGELPGTNYEEAIYEGYGPGGVAFLVETLTDNKNRTTSRLRHLFSKAGGNLGESGCVAWMFEKKGQIIIEKSQIEEDKLLDLVIEAGADDLKVEDKYIVLTPPEDFEVVKKALEEEDIKLEYAEITMIPKTYTEVDEELAKRLLNFIETLEEEEDVKDVYASFDIPEKLVQT
jgi:YebC/PmpR family DNA-binding regulatory protein